MPLPNKKRRAGQVVAEGLLHRAGGRGAGRGQQAGAAVHALPVRGEGGYR